MTLKERTQNTKAIAAELLVSLATEKLSLPMEWVAEQADEPKIKKLFRRVTVGDFLMEVCRALGKISKHYRLGVEAIASIFNANDVLPADVLNSFNIQQEAVSSIAVLGKGDAPLFERLLDAINRAIFYMKNGGHEGSMRQANLIDHFCNESGHFDITAKTLGCTRQNVEQAVKQFNKSLLEGKAWKGHDRLYTFDPDLLKDIYEVANNLTGRLVGSLRDVIGEVKGTSLDYILRMLGCEVATIGNRQFVIERGQIQPYTKIADTARRSLSKSVEAIPFRKLSEGLSSDDAAFLMRYLSTTSGVKFLKNGNVIMIGNGLDKAVRQARIIYEADGWISKDDISARYEAEYGDPIGAFAPAVLHKLGCTNHNKLGYWVYGSEKVGKVKDVILTIMTTKKPIATYNTIFKAVRANGLLYPEGTIRACITDLACPENRNHDLFCLKGYTHLYPSLSWRSYKKQPA